MILCLFNNLACLSALKEIGSEVPTGVYLPSNPEAIVVSLSPGSGAPMQRYSLIIHLIIIDYTLDVCLFFSAAKAPYRATFRVQKVGIEEVERCADENYEFIQDFTNEYSQMAIFKVGDDVRQVNESLK